MFFIDTEQRKQAVEPVDPLSPALLTDFCTLRGRRQIVAYQFTDRISGVLKRQFAGTWCKQVVVSSLALVAGVDAAACQVTDVRLDKASFAQ
ncbi:hypothetical protein VTP01DRAFT_7763 [Rhizomucor pusillus]|uniref:uncharacterized protein n=1 Tax=Rhizomucor pusillus TaxID=4840 RepID=UPI003743DC69